MDNGLVFNDVYKKYHHMVYRYIDNRIAYKMYIGEITNDVFMQVYKHLPKFDETKSKLSTWIIAIAKYRVIDHYRWFKSLRNLTYVSIDENNEFLMSQCTTVYNDSTDNLINNCAYDKDLLTDDIKAAISKLRSNVHKQVCILYYFEGKKLVDIADIMNVPLNSIKVYHLRAKKLLRTALCHTYYQCTGITYIEDKPKFAC